MENSIFQDFSDTKLIDPIDETWGRYQSSETWLQVEPCKRLSKKHMTWADHRRDDTRSALGAAVLAAMIANMTVEG